MTNITFNDDIFDLAPTIKKMEKLQKKYPHSGTGDFDINEFNKEAQEITKEFEEYVSAVNSETNNDDKEDYDLGE